MIKGVLDWPSYENPKLSPLRESEFQIFDEPEPCLESYDSSIEEEEDDGVELYTKVQEVTQVHERLKPFYESFDPEPTDYKQRISYYLYYSALYVIFIYTRPDIARPEVTDSDEELKEKAFGIHYFSIFNKFMDLMTNLSIDFYASLEKYIRKHSGADHPLLAFMQVMNNHKEMHSRRLKGVPDSQRSKEDNGVVYNIVTGQEYQYDLWKEARTKKIREDEYDETEQHNQNKWRWLIINPLPSDVDYQSIDPMEGDAEYRLNVEVDYLQGEKHYEPPYGPIVTNDFDKLLRLLHTMLHWEDYLQSYILTTVTEEDYEFMTQVDWEQAWQHLAKDHHDKPIDKLSREKKKMPAIVSRLAELRDLLKETLLIISDLNTIANE